MSGFEPTPHPVLKLPTPEQVAAMLALPDGKAKLVEFYRDREERIRLMETDPLRYGYEPPVWATARELLEEYDEILMNGGNRSSKTEDCAKLVVEDLLSGPNRVATCFHSSEKTSIALQQPRIYKFLPPEYRNLGKIKGDRVTNVNFTQKNGFADNTFILPNGSQCFFFNYFQDVSIFEGWEINIAWGDELMPRAFVEALRYRIVTRRGKLLISFTPVKGYTPTMKEYLAGATPIKTERAELLPEDRQLVKGCPKGHMPRVMRCINQNRAVLMFWTQDNPFNPYDQMRKTLAGAPEKEIMLRAYGWTEKTATGAFPKFQQGVHTISRKRWEEIERAGVTYYCSVDPAPVKNWFIKWYGVTPLGHIILFREWPSMQQAGEWAVPGDKIDWEPGPAQTFESGRGLRSYKTLIRELEGWVWDSQKNDWDPSGSIPVYLRAIDPRAGGSPHPSEEERVTLLTALDTDVYDDDGALRWPGMVFEASKGTRVEHGVRLINDLLDYDEEKELGYMNTPKFFVVEDCLQTIKAYEEWTGMGTDKCALKDIIDPDRYLVQLEPSYVEPGMFGTIGGGSW